jgi:RNA polymerase sigma factor (sigma-70 family)
MIDCVRRAVLAGSNADRTDGQLLEDYLSRHDEAAVAALVRRHGPMVWGVCRRVLHNHHDAEDAFQATFLVLIRKAASVVPREMVGNWLYGVARQTALKARVVAAKRQARERQVKGMPEPAVMPEPGLRHDLGTLVDQELSQLPEKYRVAIVLCDLEGRTRREVARQLRIPEGTLSSRLKTARSKLAKRLARHGLHVSGGGLAVVLSRKAASASVPTSVTSSTIKAVTLVASGQAAAGEAISVKVAALTEGVMKAMLFTKLKAAIAVVMVLGFVATVTAVVPCLTTAQQGVPPPAVEEKVNVSQKQEKEGFTAWGKQVGGLQAGLGYLRGQHRTYHTGEAAKLVLRVRNVSKEAVKFQYYRQFFMENPPAVTDVEGKPVPLPSEQDNEEVQVRLPVDVNLAPGKEIDLAELNFKLRPASESGNKDCSTSYGAKVSVQYDLHGTGTFTVQYERVFGMTSQGHRKLDPTLSKLATGKLELEVKDTEKLPQKRPKEGFTAWGKEVGGLQAGLGYLPGRHRAYHTGETVTLVVRVRNVRKAAVKFQYLPQFFGYKGPAVTDRAGKPVDYPYGVDDTAQVHRPANVTLAPGKDLVLGEVTLPTAVLGTGKFTVQYERVFGKTPQGRLEVDPTLTNLGTGTLDLEIKSQPPFRKVGEAAPGL